MKKSIFKIGQFFLLAAGLLAVMSACKKENTRSELRAVMNDFANSRQKAYIDPEQYNCFVVNETLRVNNSTGTITSLERDDRQCVIDGVPLNATNYNAFYPAKLLNNQSVSLSSGLNGVEINFPQTQVCTRDVNGNQIIDNPMIAQLSGFDAENNYTLHFNNVCALLKVTVRTQDAFDAIHVTMGNSAKLWGSGEISGGKVVMTGNNASPRHTVILSLPTGHYGSSAGEAFYIMIPEVNLKKNDEVKVEFMNGSSPVNSYTIRMSDDATLEYNKIHTLGNFTFNAPVFTVSSDNDKVIFAPGNLQWSYTNEGTTPTRHSINGTGYDKGTWRFAPNQYDIIGAGNTNAYGNSYGEYTGKPSGVYDDDYSYKGWFDLFLWGGSGYGTSRPFYCGVSDGYCNGSSLGNYDWGAFNTIYNPKTKVNDPYGTWRTLTSDEWEYVLLSRSGWRFSLVAVDFGSNVIVEGLLLYPDNNYHINVPQNTDGQNVDNPFCVNADLVPNTRSPIPITKAELGILDDLGCAFLPISKRMYYNTGQGLLLNDNAYYWTSNSIIIDSYIYPNYLSFTSWGGIPTVYRGTIYNASNQFMSVRLARDVK